MSNQGESYPPDSDQLELELNDARIVLPWGGRSPRALTRVVLSGIFKAQAEKKRERFDLTDQIDMFDPSTEAPRIYRGAPLLVPLPRRL